MSLAPVSDPHQTPEVVWGPGKSPDQIATKLLSLTERQRVAMAARIDPATYSAVRMHAPGGLMDCCCSQLSRPRAPAHHVQPNAASRPMPPQSAQQPRRDKARCFPDLSSPRPPPLQASSTTPAR